jgi:hypothetical protein
MSSIVNTAKSKWGRLLQTEEYPGAIVNSLFRTEPSNSTPSPSARVTFRSVIGHRGGNGQTLKTREKTALTKRVDTAIDETFDELMEGGLYNPTWTCEGSLADLTRDFDAHLETKLDPLKIKVATNYIADPSNDDVCSCPRHYNGLTVGTKHVWKRKDGYRCQGAILLDQQRPRQ